jgi:hypothetical protein
MTWLSIGSAAGDTADLLALRANLGPRAQSLCAEAAQAAPGRAAALVSARVDQMVWGHGSLAGFGALSPAEQVVVALTEQFLLDAHGIDDSLMREFGTHYDHAEQMAILFHLALADGFTKFARVFDTPGPVQEA